MPQNRIQFKPGMSLSEFITRFGTEAQCEAALKRSRWPQGFVCPHCGGREQSRFLAERRRYWQCPHCRAQTTVRSGTLLHASKSPSAIKLNNLGRWSSSIPRERRLGSS